MVGMTAIASSTIPKNPGMSFDGASTISLDGLAHATYPAMVLSIKKKALSSLTIFWRQSMNILAWIVLGLIAGAIAKAIYPGHQGGGILGTLILGVRSEERV